MKKTFAATAVALCAAFIAAAPASAKQDGSSDIQAEPETGFLCELPDGTASWPGLVQRLDAECEQENYDFQERQAEVRQSDTAMPGMADNLTYQLHWAVRGRTDQLLSLVSEIYRYDGGAHGNTAYGARIWDLSDDRAIAFASLFTDRYAAYSLIDRDFCDKIADLQRERDVDTFDGWWDECPLLHEQTIVPQGEPGRPFALIGVLVAPYVAGPYAAGSFEVSVEVTPELIALLRPEFRASFAAPGEMDGLSGGER